MSMDKTLRANERLREERLSRGWSQQKVADQLGIAVVTVNRWERGKQQPTGYYRLKLITLFEKSAEELGLAEEQAVPEAYTYTEEPQEQERVEEALFVAQTELEGLVREPSPYYEPLRYKPSLEREVPHLSHASSHVRPGISFLYRGKYRSKRTMLLLLVLILLVIVAPVTFFLVHSGTTESVSGKSVATATKSVRVFSTPQAPKKLFFNDPLTKEDDISQWQIGGPVCEFVDNALHINTPGPNYCSANVQPFDNMKFQIYMSIQQGTWSGIIFRADGDNNFYYFSVSVNGQYEVDRIKHNNSSLTKILLSGTNSAIKAGYNKVNILAVEANKSQLTFWVNGTIVDQMYDTLFTSGYVGICAGSYADSAPPDVVQANYSNASVWTI